jgi:hypothetical protein
MSGAIVFAIGSSPLLRRTRPRAVCVRVSRLERSAEFLYIEGARSVFFIMLSALGITPAKQS